MNRRPIAKRHSGFIAQGGGNSQYRRYDTGQIQQRSIASSTCKYSWIAEGHKCLFAQVEGRRHRGQMLQHEVLDQEGTRHVFEYTNDVALNNSAADGRVNFLLYEEHPPKGKVRRFSWITDFQLNTHNVMRIMRAGRSRWKN